MEGLLRIIQFIPLPKAEPFKLWLAQVGRERIEETIDPEQAVDRAMQTYLRKGYLPEWIHQRLLSIRIRNDLTAEWQGETNASMKKGLGHYSSTSAWDGNVGCCGHNRGSKYVIGSIKDLEIGDIITYTTVHGTRTYSVVSVKTISNSDWSYLQATSDNRITLTTCLANHPEKNLCPGSTENGLKCGERQFKKRQKLKRRFFGVGK